MPGHRVIMIITDLVYFTGFGRFVVEKLLDKLTYITHERSGTRGNPV